MNYPPLGTAPLGYAYADEPWDPRGGYALAYMLRLTPRGFESQFTEMDVASGNTDNCKWLKPVGVQEIAKVEVAVSNEGDVYDSADFYSCDDETEDLYHDSETEAIKEVISGAVLSTESVTKWCLANSIEVQGWKLAPWTEVEQRQAAELVVEFLNDSDVGDGVTVWGCCAPFGVEHEQAIMNALADCPPNITRCLPVASRVYKGEVLLAKVRELLPELLEVGCPWPQPTP